MLTWQEMGALTRTARRSILLGMDGFRIRVGDVEIAVPDVEGLVRLAERGKLRRTDQVRTTEGWVAAQDVAALREKFTADPWDAWADVDSVDAQSMYRQMTERGEEPEELPADAMAVVPDAPLRARATVSLPEIDPEPETDEVSGGELIAFPRTASSAPPKAGGIIRPRRGPSAPAAQPLVRWSRLLSFVVAGALLLMMSYAWVNVNANSRAGIDPAAEPAVARARPAGGPTDTVPDSLIKLDAELRSKLPSVPRMVAKPGDLGDALTIELIQLGVNVIGVEANVVKWVGRKKDEPKTAEIRVTFESSGDLAREMGAMAMVLGRYKRFYRLELPILEVIERTTGGRTALDPEKVEQLYQGRMPLGKFLSEIGR